MEPNSARNGALGEYKFVRCNCEGKNDLMSDKSTTETNFRNAQNPSRQCSIPSSARSRTGQITAVLLHRTPTARITVRAHPPQNTYGQAQQQNATRKSRPSRTSNTAWCAFRRMLTARTLLRGTSAQGADSEHLRSGLSSSTVASWTLHQAACSAA